MKRSPALPWVDETSICVRVTSADPGAPDGWCLELMTASHGDKDDVAACSECPLWKNETGDELHFIFYCPNYSSNHYLLFMPSIVHIGLHDACSTAMQA